MKKRIALLYGGASSEHEVSLMGYEYVSRLLFDTEYEILPVYISRAGEWYITSHEVKIPASLSANDGGSLYTDYGFIKIDAAIPLIHGEGGEDGTLQGALDTVGVRYIGADTVASAVCIDKVYTKAVAASLGIPTVEGVSYSQPTDTDSALSECEGRLGFPMFIKPRRLGSSVGAFPVYCKEDFTRHFPVAMEKGGNLVTVERLLESKREIECAFVEVGGERIITPPGEILVNGFYGYGEKYGGKTDVMDRANLDKDTEALVLDYSRRLCDGLCLKHLARIDYFLCKDGLYFNEINTFPGFTEESLYPKMLKAAGIPVKDALISFIEDALSC